MSLPSDRSSGLVACALSAWLGAGPAQAVDIGSLPQVGSTEWSIGVWTNTFMNHHAGPPASTALVTAADGSGAHQIVFGHFGSARPGWSIGSHTEGNLLALNLSFSANAKDWNAYLYDGSGYAAGFSFLPTDCACALGTPNASVAMVFGQAGTPSHRFETVSGLDMTQPHQFDMLLKNGQVSYRIDGVVYTGPRWWSNNSNQLLLLIGDTGYGPGVGSMTVNAVPMNTAPTANLLSPIPESSHSLLLLLGLGGLAAGRRAWCQRPAPHSRG